MTEFEKALADAATRTLNKAFALVRCRAAELRASRDFYDSDYIAPEIERLPGYVAGRMHLPDVKTHPADKLDEIARQTHPGFAILCEGCGSGRVMVECEPGWTCTDVRLKCVDCEASVMITDEFPG
jgi:hypothetical protein